MLLSDPPNASGRAPIFTEPQALGLWDFWPARESPNVVTFTTELPPEN